MPCYHSRPAWKPYSPDPDKIIDRRLFFQPPRPYRDPDYFIDCQKCEGCKQRARQDWAIRMIHESKEHDRNCFLTITYDDEHLPEKIILNDLKNFIKRMRYKSDREIRYYACGEYGEKTRRPHYHAVIFNEDFLSSRYHYTVSDSMYGNKELEQIWGKGRITISEFNPARAFYTAGYIAKKLNDPDTFAMQSRRPPLGRKWVQKHYDDLRRLKGVFIDGQKYPVPRVYLNWLKGTEAYYEIAEALNEEIRALPDNQLKAKKLHFKAKENLRTFKV